MSLPVEFTSCPIISLEPEGKDCSLLVIDIKNTSLTERHSLPGQYVQIKLADETNGYFALANTPAFAKEKFEFLIKKGGKAADAILALSTPSNLSLSVPSGPGFPLEKARGKNVVLLAMGSGISAIRPVLQTIAHERENFEKVILLQGDRSESHMPFFREHADWKKANIDVFPVFSKQESTYRGYVQDQLKNLSVDNTLFFLVGSKEMMASSRLILAQKQVGPDKIFSNF